MGGIVLEMRPLAPEAPIDRSSVWVERALWSALCVFAVALGLNPRRGGDFHIYLLAARRFSEALPLYPLTDGAMPFKYAPAAAWLFAWGLPLPAPLATALFNVGSVAALAWAARRWRLAVEEEAATRVPVWGVALVTLALGQSVFQELFYGQVDLWMLALLTLAAGSGRGRSAGPGLALAVAMLLKPTAALVAGGLLLSRRFRPVLWAVLWAAALFTPVLVRYGPAGAWAQVHAWSDTLARTTPPWVIEHNPQGLPTLLLAGALPGHGVPSAAQLSWASGLSLALLWVVPLVLRLSGTALFGFLCLAVAFASPLAWRANFVLAWPALYVLLARSQGRRRAAALTVLALVGVTGAVVSEALLGPARFREAMLLRPFGWSFLLVLVSMALAFRAPLRPFRAPWRATSAGPRTRSADPTGTPAASSRNSGR